MYLQRDIARTHNQKLMGQTVDVLLERVSDESDLVLIGRTAQQAPDIDGITYVETAVRHDERDLAAACRTTRTYIFQDTKRSSELSPHHHIQSK